MCVLLLLTNSKCATAPETSLETKTPEVGFEKSALGAPSSSARPRPTHTATAVRAEG